MAYPARMNEIVREGLRLSYTDIGLGEPALLFIHGNSCDRSFFAPQIERFAAAHRCIAPDLRGHGESDAPKDASYTFHALTDDLAHLCRSIGAPRVVAVGHSLGGALAVRLAASRPDMVAGVVALDSTLIPQPGFELWLDPLLARLGRDPEAPFPREFFEPLFAAEDDPARRAEIMARLAKTPRHVTTALFALFRDPDYEQAARAVRCPFLYVGAHKHRTDPQALRRLIPQAHFAQTALCGHFQTLEAPEQINAMLKRFLAVHFSA